MSMKKKPIGEATNAELMAYAQEVLGIDVKLGTGNVHIIAKIREAQPDITEILYTEAAASAPMAALDVPMFVAPIGDEGQDGPPPTSHHNDPKVRIMIPKTEGPGGESDVPVSVNGYQWIIKRDEEIRIPYRVFEGLKLAMQTLYEQVKSVNPYDRPEVRERKVLSYPFNVLEMPPASEIAAYRARTDDVFAP